MPWILVKARKKKIVGVLLNLYLKKKTFIFQLAGTFDLEKDIPGYPDLLKHVCDRIIFIKK
jgi:hypothetical protein